MMSDTPNDKMESDLSPQDEEHLSLQLSKFHPSRSIDDAKIHSWATLMNQAAMEATEERLKKLRPKAPSQLATMKWSLAMDEAKEASAVADHSKAVSKSPVVHHTLRWWGAACAAVLILGGLAMTLLRDAQVVNDPTSSNLVATTANPTQVVGTGDLNRQTVRIVDNGVNWNAESGKAERSYLVDYEDSVELQDNNGNRVLISAPATKMVVVPVETY
jgi:hypothetical protein